MSDDGLCGSHSPGSSVKQTAESPEIPSLPDNGASTSPESCERQLCGSTEIDSATDISEAQPPESSERQPSTECFDSRVQEPCITDPLEIEKDESQTSDSSNNVISEPNQIHEPEIAVSLEPEPAESSVTLQRKSKSSASAAVMEEPIPCPVTQQQTSESSAIAAIEEEPTPCQIAHQQKSEYSASAATTMEATPCPVTQQQTSDSPAIAAIEEEPTPCQITHQQKSEYSASAATTMEATPCPVTHQQTSDSPASAPITEETIPLTSRVSKRARRRSWKVSEALQQRAGGGGSSEESQHKRTRSGRTLKVPASCEKQTSGLLGSGKQQPQFSESAVPNSDDHQRPSGNSSHIESFNMPAIDSCQNQRPLRSSKRRSGNAEKLLVSPENVKDRSPLKKSRTGRTIKMSHIALQAQESNEMSMGFLAKKILGVKTLSKEESLCAPPITRDRRRLARPVKPVDDVKSVHVNKRKSDDMEFNAGTSQKICTLSAVKSHVESVELKRLLISKPSAKYEISPSATSNTTGPPVLSTVEQLTTSQKSPVEGAGASGFRVFKFVNQNAQRPLEDKQSAQRPLLPKSTPEKSPPKIHRKISVEDNMDTQRACNSNRIKRDFFNCEIPDMEDVDGQMFISFGTKIGLDAHISREKTEDAHVKPLTELQQGPGYNMYEESPVLLKATSLWKKKEHLFINHDVSELERLGLRLKKTRKSPPHFEHMQTLKRMIESEKIGSSAIHSSVNIPNDFSSIKAVKMEEDNQSPKKLITDEYLKYMDNLKENGSPMWVTPEKTKNKYPTKRENRKSKYSCHVDYVPKILTKTCAELATSALDVTPLMLFNPRVTEPVQASSATKTKQQQKKTLVKNIIPEQTGVSILKVSAARDIAVKNSSGTSVLIPRIAAAQATDNILKLPASSKAETPRRWDFIRFVSSHKSTKPQDKIPVILIDDEEESTITSDAKAIENPTILPHDLSTDDKEPAAPVIQASPENGESIPGNSACRDEPEKLSNDNVAQKDEQTNPPNEITKPDDVDVVPADVPDCIIVEPVPVSEEVEEAEVESSEATDEGLAKSAESSKTTSCNKPGCLYGCVCHLCELVSDKCVDAPINNLPQCDKEYCRLGCICDSLNHADKSVKKSPKKHCGKQDCMIECTCNTVKLSAAGRPLRSCTTNHKRPVDEVGEFYLNSIESALSCSELPILSHSETIAPEDNLPKDNQLIPSISPQAIQIIPHEKSQDVPHEIPQELPHEISQDQPHETLLELPHEISQDQPDQPHETSLELPHEISQDQPDQPHETSLELPHEISQDQPDQPHETSPELPHKISQDQPHETSLELPHEIPQEQSFETPEDPLLGPSHEIPQEVLHESPSVVPLMSNEEVLPYDKVDSENHDGFLEMKEEFPPIVIQPVENFPKILEAYSLPLLEPQSYSEELKLHLLADAIPRISIPTADTQEGSPSLPSEVSTTGNPGTRVLTLDSNNSIISETSNSFILLDNDINFNYYASFYILNIQGPPGTAHLQLDIVAWVRQLLYVNSYPKYTVPKVIQNYSVRICAEEDCIFETPEMFKSVINCKPCALVRVVVLKAVDNTPSTVAPSETPATKMKKQMVWLQRKNAGSVSYSPQLLEIRADVDWNPIKDKLLSKMATLTKGVTYPALVSMAIGGFLIETLPKSSKMTLIPKRMQTVLKATSMYTVKVRITGLPPCKVSIKPVSDVKKVLADSTPAYISNMDASIDCNESIAGKQSTPQKTLRFKTMLQKPMAAVKVLYTPKKTKCSSVPSKHIVRAGQAHVKNPEHVEIGNLNSYIVTKATQKSPLAISFNSPLVNSISLVAEDVTIDSVENPDTMSNVSQLLKNCKGDLNFTIDHTQDRTQDDAIDLTEEKTSTKSDSNGDTSLELRPEGNAIVKSDHNYNVYLSNEKLLNSIGELVKAVKPLRLRKEPGSNHGNSEGDDYYWCLDNADAMRKLMMLFPGAKREDLCLAIHNFTYSSARYHGKFVEYISKRFLHTIAQHCLVPLHQLIPQMETPRKKLIRVTDTHAKHSPEKKCKSRRVPVATASGDDSFYDDEERTPGVKRMVHNILERKRRNDLRHSFRLLHTAIKDVHGSDGTLQPAKVLLLKMATDTIERLKKKNSQQLLDKRCYQLRNRKLERKLAELQRTAPTHTEILSHDRSNPMIVDEESNDIETNDNKTNDTKDSNDCTIEVDVNEETNQNSTDRKQQGTSDRQRKHSTDGKRRRQGTSDRQRKHSTDGKRRRQGTSDRQRQHSVDRKLQGTSDSQPQHSSDSDRLQQYSIDNKRREHYNSESERKRQGRLELLNSFDLLKNAVKQTGIVEMTATSTNQEILKMATETIEVLKKENVERLMDKHDFRLRNIRLGRQLLKLRRTDSQPVELSNDTSNPMIVDEEDNDNETNDGENTNNCDMNGDTNYDANEDTNVDRNKDISKSVSDSHDDNAQLSTERTDAMLNCNNNNANEWNESSDEFSSEDDTMS